jgi:DNA-binding transcriptional LysR family regulator
LLDGIITVWNETSMPWDDRIRRQLSLRDLNILMAVMQAGGMGKAAARLHISQPSVSKAIADLEHTLGVRLLDRTRRGAEPTPYGLALIKRGFAMFDELRRGIEDIDFLSDPTAGEIRIGTTEPIAAAIVSPVIDQLSQQYPKMNFYVIAGDTGMLYRQLSERSIELVISRMTGAATEEQTAEVLFYDPLVVVTGNSNPLTRRGKLKLVDLMEEPWTVQPTDSFFGSIVAEAFRVAGLAPPRLAVATTSFNLRSELLATGRFLTVVPGFSVRLPRPHRSLRVLPVEFPNVRHAVAIITLRGRSLSPLTHLFIDRLRAITKPLTKRPRR